MTTIEDLSKTQIILLTLLISFVTSIATGIITTSLLASAPESVTQTINRVVERTIETVSNPSTSTNTKEVTVVKEEDAIIASIDKASPSVVRLSGPTADGGTSFYAWGVIVSPEGLVLTDKKSLVDNVSYSALLSDGSTVSADLVDESQTDNIALFKLHADANHKSFSAVAISSSEPKLGQTVIALQGKDKLSVAVGRVTSLDTTAGKNSKGESVMNVYGIETDIASDVSGGPLVNLSGELVGLKSSNDDLTLSKNRFLSLSASVRAFLTRH